MSGLRWLTRKDEVRAAVQSAQGAGQRVGLVPTMGNLHEGHASLFRQAASETSLVVASIFVNPIQFCPGEDFEAYPRTPVEDRAICEASGVDIVFAPDPAEMFPVGFTTRIQVVETEKNLCGRNRPGHFIGVATIVAKLFHLIPADVAYFGAKDYQQTLVIRRMVEDLDFPIEIRVCPTVREPDGLAKSSRNRYLEPEERRQAVCLKESLDLAQRLITEGEREAGTIRRRMIELISSRSLADIDYVEIVDPRTLTAVDRINEPPLASVAVRIGKARLIDNAILRF